MSGRDTAGVIAPPPLIFLAAAALGLGADWLLAIPPLGLPLLLRWALAAVMFAGGLAIGLSAIRSFREAGTPPEPWEPTRAFVARGPYRFTRNPMYLGMALGLIAIGLAANSIGVLLMVPVTILVMNAGVIAREERYMSARFGAPYLEWKARTRRWI